MRIKSLNLQNFKRFTDLKISDIPQESKLVLLIGSNGSGKSSLFDAFNWVSKGPNALNEYLYGKLNNYYKKIENEDSFLDVNFYDADKIEKKNGKRILYEDQYRLSNKFIGRSSIRIIPKISINGDSGATLNDSDKPEKYIDHDSRFVNDVYKYIEVINEAVTKPVFQGKQADTLEIFKENIEPLNKSLLKVFGDNTETTIQIIKYENPRPDRAANLIFKKGLSEISYELLSHGEKQVIILLLNFIVRQEFYQDSIIFIDEMDCHLNTALQYSLLEEIVSRWIPDSSQLWTASHSLGFIDYARKSKEASIIDFDLLNFDYPQELRPLPKDELDVYEIAIPKEIIKDVLKDFTKVFVENKNDEFFNLVFLGEEKNKYVFLGVNNSSEVFLSCKNNKFSLGIRDRDYLKEEEVHSIKEKIPNLKILSFYNFENYIYHPENLKELALKGFDEEEYKNEICRQKNLKRDEILLSIGEARQHYLELKEFFKKEDIKDKTYFAKALESNNFNDYYPIFDMKKYFDKSYLQKFQLTTQILVKTDWFKEQIKKVLIS
jgi:AAA15 family ATPase/GTPase